MKKHKKNYNFFADCILKKYISKADFNQYIQCKQSSEKLDSQITKKIANAMKTWAFKNNAIYFTHWFQPLTGKSAGKQISFFEFKDENLIENFDAKILMHGETDASSFPNGGQRMIFEARGYTVWDYTSHAILWEYEKNKKVLLIPTAFCSYHSVALDEKTPLLRAIENLNKKVLHLFKKLNYNEAKYVTVNVGSEQEYFLIDKETFLKRPDLILCGRTLLSKNIIKSQEQHKNYFQSISPKVHDFMEEVNQNLLKMGISIKLQHNEVAPCQYEIVPIYTNCNQSCDNNQLIMETLKNVADKHNFVALLTEKPFFGINGSGKHVNWSISTDKGINLLDCNSTNKDLFLTFLTLVISAIDEYNGLVRLSASHYQNDFRLGGDEAPPPIISVYLGNFLTNLLENIDKSNGIENKTKIDMRVKCLPNNIADSCDRNRTSPFAFTGNKFEFRMIGSNQNLSFANTVLITALSEKIEEFANKLEKNNLYSLLKTEYQKHKKIVFNGNGYSLDWQKEAKKRNLPIFENCLDCIEVLNDKKIINLFTSQNVLSEKEIDLRKEILFQNYTNSALCEAKCLNNLIFSKIEPMFINQIIFLNEIKDEIVSNIYLKTKDKFAKTLEQLHKYAILLNDQIQQTSEIENEKEKAYFTCKNILPQMNLIRKTYDDIENEIFAKFKCLPTYNEILYNANI